MTHFSETHRHTQREEGRNTNAPTLLFLRVAFSPQWELGVMFVVRRLAIFRNTTPPATSAPAANNSRDHPLPVLGRLLATEAGRFFFTEFPVSLSVLVKVFGRSSLMKTPPRSKVPLTDSVP